jgi:hypothetical protein
MDQLENELNVSIREEKLNPMYEYIYTGQSLMYLQASCAAAIWA